MSVTRKFFYEASSHVSKDLMFMSVHTKPPPQDLVFFLTYYERCGEFSVLLGEWTEPQPMTLDEARQALTQARSYLIEDVTSAGTYPFKGPPRLIARPARSVRIKRLDQIKIEEKANAIVAQVPDNSATLTLSKSGDRIEIQFSPKLSDVEFMEDTLLQLLELMSARLG